MKVLFFTNIPSPYRVDFFNELAEKCELTVVYERNNASDRNVKWKSNESGKYTVHYLKGIKYSNDASLSLEFKRILKKQPYDIVIVSGYSSLTQMAVISYLRRKHIHFVLNIDGAILKTESKIKHAIKTWFISGASYWLSTGSESDRFLIDHGAEKDKIFRYPFTSISESEILKENISDKEKDEAKQRIGFENKKVVLSVGQPIYRKGFDVLIRAMNHFTESGICAVIVGGEPYPECVEELKKAKNDNVFFVPFKTKEELADYYMAADVFAFPTREDIWGLVVNEAMAYGLPIVTTEKCNAGLELVANGKNGYIVPSDNADALYDAIHKIIYESDYKLFSAESLCRIKSHSIENMAETHIKIFENILRLD